MPRLPASTVEADKPIETAGNAQPTDAVSVVIPTRNRAARLLPTLESALAQKHVRVEVVVVDDGSKDDTSAVVEQMDDPRVRLIRHDESRGVARSRNAGIELASCPWVAFLDDDDRWSPRKLSVQIASLKAAGAGWGYGKIVIVDVDGTVRVDPLLPDPDHILEHLIGGGPIPAGGSNVIVATDVLRSVGGFDGRLKHLADWDLWLRLACRSGAAACDEAVMAYIEHPTAMHYEPELRLIADEFDYLLAKHAGTAREHGLVLDDRQFWLWLASNQLKMGRRSHAFGVWMLHAYRRRDPRSVLRAVRSVTGPASGARSVGHPVGESPAWLDGLDRPA